MEKRREKWWCILCSAECRRMIQAQIDESPSKSDCDHDDGCFVRVAIHAIRQHARQSGIIHIHFDRFFLAARISSENVLSAWKLARDASTTSDNNNNNTNITNRPASNDMLKCNDRADARIAHKHAKWSERHSKSIMLNDKMCKWSERVCAVRLCRQHKNDDRIDMIYILLQLSTSFARFSVCAHCVCESSFCNVCFLVAVVFVVVVFSVLSLGSASAHSSYTTANTKKSTKEKEPAGPRSEVEATKSHILYRKLQTFSKHRMKYRPQNEEA